MLLTEEDFRSTVPESNYFVSVSFDGKTESASKTEISKFYDSILVDQQVLRLKVSMHHSVSMAVGGSLKNLIGETLHFLRRKRTSHMAHILLQVVLAILKYQVELVFRIKHFFESNRAR